MAFKLDKGIPKGKLVPMWLSDEGNIYSFRFKDEAQIEEVSNMLAIMLSGIVGSPLVLDTTPLNAVGCEVYKIENKGQKEKLKKV